MSVVVFSYSDWALRYAELAASVIQPLAQLYFNEAGLYLNNTDGSIVSNVTERAALLNMLTAHIAALNAGLNGQPPVPLVGRITNASEGSVSVATQNDYPPGSPQWYQQTKYGAAFWAATGKYRSMQYVPGPRRNFNPSVGPWR